MNYNIPRMIKLHLILKNSLVLLCVYFLSLTSYGQTSPGGVGVTNLTAWWKPDALANGNVTSWTTTYPTGASAITVIDISSPYPQVTDIPAGAVSNYNKTIDFTGNTLTSLRALQTNTAHDLLDNSSAGDQGSFYSAYLTPISASNDHILLYQETSFGVGDAIQFRLLGANNTRLAISTGIGNSLNASRDWTNDFRPNIGSYIGNRSGSTAMRAYDKSFLTSPNVASESSGTLGIHMGVRPGISTSPYNGYIHEYIFFNRDLNATENIQVHTYLAIKYGVTLRNTGGGAQGDYINTDGIIIWDASVNTQYHNDVIGIGRDDIEDMLQKQSHTFDDTTRIYLNTLQATNSANMGNFSSDVSYVVMGHNTGQMCATNASNLEVPTGLPSCNLFSRLEREWKVSRTNMADNFNVDLVLNVCANTASVSTSHLRLLVDDDGDFSNGGTSCYYNGDGTGIFISYNAPEITVSGISTTHIPDNATRYITIASINAATPLPIEVTKFIAECEDNTVVLNWETASEFNNDFFSIERSRDITNFELIAIVDGNGTTSAPHSYQFIDKNPISMTSYYRLSQTDFDGSVNHEDIRAVNCVDIEEFLVYPNPFNDNFVISSLNNGEISIMDITGRIILEKSFDAGKTTIDLNNFSKATYIAFVKLANGKSQTIKLIKQ